MKHEYRTSQLRTLVLSLLLLSLPVLIHAAARDPQRIEIRAGSPARIIKGEIRGRKEVIYVFRAKAGQKFSGRITRLSADAGFAVTDPADEALPEEEFDVNTSLKGSLKRSGDYKITVNTVNSENSKYSLSVRVY